MNRRNLIKTSTATLLSGCAVHFQDSADNDHDTANDTPSVSCTPTPSQQEGPYYDTNIAERSDLNPSDGEPLELTLYVEDESCQPIDNAKVEIWHANAAGEYDLVSDVRDYYAMQYTDEYGGCAFTTLIPGAYLNGPNDYRPKHIHIKIWVNNQERLTTQLYFEGDSFLSFEPDTPTELMLKLTGDSSGWNSEYHFVIA